MRCAACDRILSNEELLVDDGYMCKKCMKSSYDGCIYDDMHLSDIQDQEEDNG